MKNNKKGFTLAEMLIVVAIIGVLIAILVPTFSAQLDKAKHAKDLANVRSAIAEVTANGLTGATPTSKSVTLETTLNEEVGGVSFSGVSGTITISYSGGGITY